MNSTSFRGLSLKIAYESDTDDVLSEFFIPILKESSLYKRVSAYYSSESLKVIGEGLAEMTYNNGKVQLLVSHLVSERDYDAIKRAKTEPSEVLDKIIVNNIDDLKMLMEDDNVAALAYLLAVGRLELKFAICKDEMAIFHLKFGIFQDFDDNYVSFSGSINETYMGFVSNVEEFKVFRSWMPEEKKYLDGDLEKFNSYWNKTATSQDVIVVDLPEKTKKLIIEEAEKTGSLKAKRFQPKSLRPTQRKALKLWNDSGKKGILRMATGSGKTLIGVYAILDLIEKYKDSGVIIVVGCPTTPLAKQWHTELNTFHFPENCSNYLLHDTVTKEELYMRIKYGENRKIIIIGTYSTLHKSWFTNEILPRTGYKIAFIADEAHWLGAKEFSAALSNKYEYRLGLTATPIRNFDIEGTKLILEYFGGAIFDYPIKKAIEDKVLTQYYYNIRVGHLTDSELNEYAKETKKYARYLHFPKEKYGDIASNIAFKRAKIIKKAKCKIMVFREILEKLKSEGKLNYLLVYCEDNNHIQEYRPILDEFGVRSRIVKSGMTQRQISGIITDFEQSDIDCIIAMKIFDEGIDVKAARRGIFLSSTSNPKQFIQRRGRLLRTARDKEYAEVFDIVILPELENLDDAIKKIETSIVSKEINRVLVFSADAKNYYDCYKTLEREYGHTNINVWKMISNIGGRGS